MSKKIGIIGLSGLLIGLIVIIIVLGSVRDSEGPKISYDKKMPYYDETMDQSVLLEGVRAIDDKDGDVTDSLKIQDINYVTEQEGIVQYVAVDKSNNVTTKKRKFQTLHKMEVLDESVQASSQAVSAESITTADAVAEGTDSGEMQSGQTDDMQNTAQNTAQDADALKQQQIAQNLPYIRLTEHEVTIARGGTFVVQNYIAEIENCGTNPYQRIRMDGDSVKTSTAGTYHVKVYVTDANNQMSNVEELIVIVQ